MYYLSWNKFLLKQCDSFAFLPVSWSKASWKDCLVSQSGRSFTSKYGTTSYFHFSSHEAILVLVAGATLFPLSNDEGITNRNVIPPSFSQIYQGINRICSWQMYDKNWLCLSFVTCIVALRENKCLYRNFKVLFSSILYMIYYKTWADIHVVSINIYVHTRTLYHINIPIFIRSSLTSNTSRISVSRRGILCLDYLCHPLFNPSKCVNEMRRNYICGIQILNRNKLQKITQSLMPQ